MAPCPWSEPLHLRRSGWRGGDRCRLPAHRFPAPSDIPPGQGL